MPIAVKCKCGQKLTAKDSLAGKAVKCPKCGQPLKIPSPQKKQAPAKQAPAKKQTQRPAPAPVQPAGGLANLLEEAGLGAEQEQAGPKCPSCGAPVDPNAIICVGCGYNSQTGDRMAVQGVATAAKADLSEAEKMVAKAAEEIKETPIDTAGGSFGEGVEAYLFTFGMIIASAIGLGLGGLFIYYVNTKVFPEGEEQTFAGTVVFTCVTFGSILFFLGWIDVVFRAFQDNVFHGLGSMTIVYSLIYARIRSFQLPRAILLILLGLNLSYLGYIMWLESQGIPSPHTPWVRISAGLLGIVFFDVWFISEARLVSMTFDNKDETLLQKTLCLLAVPYTYVYAFMHGGRYMTSAIVGLVALVLWVSCEVFYLLNAL